jgi:hypothetical protein
MSVHVGMIAVFQFVFGSKPHVARRALLSPPPLLRALYSNAPPTPRRSMTHYKAKTMEGVAVRGEFFAFDCEEIRFRGLDVGEAEVLPLLESFGRGQFTRVKRIDLVLVALHASPLPRLKQLIQNHREPRQLIRGGILYLVRPFCFS